MTKINLHGEWNFQLDKDKQGLILILKVMNYIKKN